MEQQDVFLHARFIGFLEEWGQIACLTHCEQTFRRACHPCQHPGKHPEGERYGDNGGEPVHVECLEVVVETNQKALHQVYILGRDDYSEGECAEHEDKNRYQCPAEHSFRIVDGGVLDVANVHTRHFHPGIEQED